VRYALCTSTRSPIPKTGDTMKRPESHQSAGCWSSQMGCPPAPALFDSARLHNPNAQAHLQAPHSRHRTPGTAHCATRDNLRQARRKHHAAVFRYTCRKIEALVPYRVRSALRWLRDARGVAHRQQANRAVDGRVPLAALE